MADNIPVKILNALQEAGTETVEEGIRSTEQVISTVVTGQELVGNVKEMTEGEMAIAKTEDEKKKQEELMKMKQQAPGRNIDVEINEIINEKKSDEEEKEKEFLEKIREQREAEERERESFGGMPGNTKREAAKTQFAPGKRKKQQPDLSQVSQTSEFKGGKID